MKRVLIYLFLSCSLFLIMGAFVSKARGKPPVYYQTILYELESSKIGYDIENDIKLLGKSMSSITHLNQGGNDVITILKNIGDSIYYFGKFIVSSIFDTLIASINIIILALRCVGFSSLDYIRISNATGVIIPNGFNDAIGRG